MNIYNTGLTACKMAAASCTDLEVQTEYKHSLLVNTLHDQIGEGHTKAMRQLLQSKLKRNLDTFDVRAMLNALTDKQVIQVGKYRYLKQVLSDIHVDRLVPIVEETEKSIHNLLGSNTAEETVHEKSQESGEGSKQKRTDTSDHSDNNAVEKGEAVSSGSDLVEDAETCTQRNLVHMQEIPSLRTSNREQDPIIVGDLEEYEELQKELENEPRELCRSDEEAPITSEQELKNVAKILERFEELHNDACQLAQKVGEAYKELRCYVDKFEKGEADASGSELVEEAEMGTHGELIHLQESPSLCSRGSVQEHNTERLITSEQETKTDGDLQKYGELQKELEKEPREFGHSAEEASKERPITSEQNPIRMNFDEVLELSKGMDNRFRDLVHRAKIAPKGCPITSEQEPMNLKEILESVRRSINEFRDLVQSAEEASRKLHCLADEIDECCKECNRGKTVGSVTSLLGFPLLAVGFGLSFVTFGASLGLSIAGAALSGTGGIAAAGFGLAEHFTSKSKCRAAQKAVNAVQEKAEAYKKMLEVLREMVPSSDANSASRNTGSLVSNVPSGVGIPVIRLTEGVADDVATVLRSMSSGPRTPATYDIYTLAASSLVEHRRTSSPQANKIRELAKEMHRVAQKGNEFLNPEDAGLLNLIS